MDHSLDEILSDALTMGLYLSEVDTQYYWIYHDYLVMAKRTDLID